MTIAPDACKPRPLLLVFFYTVLAVPIATPQIVDTARISGVIRDASGARVANAHIALRSGTTEWALSLPDINEGRFSTPRSHQAITSYGSTRLGFRRSSGIFTSRSRRAPQ